MRWLCWSAVCGAVGHYVRITRRKGYSRRNCLGRAKHGAQLSVRPPPHPHPHPTPHSSLGVCGLCSTHVSNFVRGLLNFFPSFCFLAMVLLLWRLLTQAAFIWPKRKARGIRLIWLPIQKRTKKVHLAMSCWLSDAFDLVFSFFAGVRVQFQIIVERIGFWRVYLGLIGSICVAIRVSRPRLYKPDF